MKHRDTKIYIHKLHYTSRLNLICFQAPDGSEERFQLINNVSSTCIKLNRWLLVIMNVLMDLSDRSGSQTIGNSLISLSVFFCCLKVFKLHLKNICLIFLSSFTLTSSNNQRFTFIRAVSRSLSFCLSFDPADLCFSFYEYLSRDPCVAP